MYSQGAEESLNAELTISHLKAGQGGNSSQTGKNPDVFREQYSSSDLPSYQATLNMCIFVFIISSSENMTGVIYVSIT